MERAPVVAYIALGANLGDAATTVRASMQAIGRLPQVELLHCSSLYRTVPLDADGPDYVNAVVAVRTTTTAHDLLAALQQLEQAALRERPYRHAPRTLDLDLLLYGDGTIRSATLELPHPRMDGRAFVLVPLAQIAPERVPAAALQAVAGQACEPLPD
jgi:2-amino-4-hydroxy-6-hydroxymethyldihydropteridine diphosphokinase